MQRKKTFDSFRRCKVVILSVLMSFCMTAAFAQSGAVKGKVLDEQGEPIIGANIVEKGTTNGTITDIDGNYTLKKPFFNFLLLVITLWKKVLKDVTKWTLN